MAESSVLSDDGLFRTKFIDVSPKKKSLDVSIQRLKMNVSNQYTPLATFSVGLSSIVAEAFLTHPCIVVRRQCQVRHDADWCHMTPFTVLPVMFRIGQHQGVSCLWKGLGSMFIFRGLGLVTETVVGDVTSLPKDVNQHSSVKKLAQHLLLKCVTWCIITPFYAASVVETVQSEVASERPGVLDCLKEGVARIIRMVQLAGGATPVVSSRLLSLHRLIPPTLCLGVSSYVLTKATQYVILTWLRKDEEEEADYEQLLRENATADGSGADPVAAVQHIYRRFYPELLASFAGNFVSDFLLFPWETLVHRLCVQGTRTILDDLDTGTSVTPATAAYTGAADAARTIFSQEGISGFYKGFGALLLQYALHLALLRAARSTFEFLGHAYSTSAPAQFPTEAGQRWRRQQQQGRQRSMSSCSVESSGDSLAEY